MAYSDFYLKKSPQIPVVLAAGIVVLSLFLIGRFVFTKNTVPTQASKNQPKVTLASPTSTSTTLLWQTDSKKQGWVLWGEKNTSLTNVALDLRDTSANKGSYKNHITRLEKLKPNTTYFYKIIVGNQIVEAQGGQAFTFSTLDTINKVSSVKPAYGKIVSPKGKPVEDAIVVAMIDGAFPLSTLTKSSGEWLIPFNFVIDSKTKGLKVLSDSQLITISIYDENNTSTIKSTVNSINQLPTIELGKNYELGASGGSVLSASNQTPKEVNSVQITFPKRNAIIPSANPLIKGTGVPEFNIALTIVGQKKTINTRTRVGADGTWKADDVRNLSPGEYTLTISTRDNQNKPVVKTSSFTIAKSGEQVLGEATPEASPTLAPTTTPTPVLVTNLSPSPPVTGASPLPFVFASTALIIVGLGLLLAF